MYNQAEQTVSEKPTDGERWWKSSSIEMCSLFNELWWPQVCSDGWVLHVNMLETYQTILSTLKNMFAPVRKHHTADRAAGGG